MTSLPLSKLDERAYMEYCYQFKDRPKPEGYVESHHIVPRALGGPDDEDNLVWLTYPEHIEAHWLLWRWRRSPEAAHAFSQMCNYGKKKKDQWELPNADRMADLTAARIQATKAARERGLANADVLREQNRTNDLAVALSHQGRSWLCLLNLMENGKSTVTHLYLPAKRFSAEQLRAEAVALRALRDERGWTVAEMKAHWLQVRQPELTGKKPRKPVKKPERRAVKARRVEGAEWLMFSGQSEAAKVTGCRQGTISKQLLGVHPYAAGLPGEGGSRWMFEFA